MRFFEFFSIIGIIIYINNDVRKRKIVSSSFLLILNREVQEETISPSSKHFPHLPDRNFIACILSNNCGCRRRSISFLTTKNKYDSKNSWSHYTKRYWKLSFTILSRTFFILGTIFTCYTCTNHTVCELQCLFGNKAYLPDFRSDLLYFCTADVLCRASAFLVHRCYSLIWVLVFL